MHRIEGENVDVTTGVNLFKTTPPYTVITPELMNAIQEEIMYVISQAGMPLLNKSNDTRDQLWTAMSRTIQPYNYVVSSQATFNALFTRTAANTYKRADTRSLPFCPAVIRGAIYIRITRHRSSLKTGLISTSVRRGEI